MGTNKKVNDVNYIRETLDRGKKKMLCHINLLTRYYEHGDANTADFHATVACNNEFWANSDDVNGETTVHLADTADEAGRSLLDATARRGNG